MLKIRRGAAVLPITFPAGTDLTGCTIYVTVKPEALVDPTDLTDANAVIKGKLVFTTPPLSLRVLVPLTFTSSSIDLEADYRFDVVVKDSGGVPHSWVNKPQPCRIVPTVTQDTND